MKIKPDWIINYLSISQIDDLRNTFNWFPSDLSKFDRNSFEEDGIRLPLMVQSMEDSKFRLIDGFKRLSWLKSVQGHSSDGYQQDQLPCLIIPASVSVRDVAKIRLDSLSANQNSFSGIHLCRVINMLYEGGFSKKEISFQVFPRLGLISSVQLVNRLLDLQKKFVTLERYTGSLLPESITKMGYEDLLPLLKFISSDFAYVVNFSEKIEVKGKKWRSLLQALDEVIRLRKTTASEILKFPDIQKTLEDSNIQGPVRYRLLKQQIDSLRYPELSRMRKIFYQKSKNLKLSKRMILESDQYFENDELTLKMKFRSVDELKEHLMNLSHTLNSENLIYAWNDLFAILREE